LSDLPRRRQPGAVWEGHYYDGASPHRHDVRVEVTEAGLVVQFADGQETLWHYDDLLQTQGFHAGEVVRFEHGPESLAVPDAGILRAIRLLAAGYAQRFHDPRSRSLEWPIFIGAAVAAAGLLVAGWVWGLPAATGFAADRIPVAWEEELGRSVTENLAPRDKRCGDPARLAAIEGMVARLVGDGSRYRYKVAVAREDVVNAFAAPGGHVVVFSGLLERTRRPEELAGVLAHEIEHVEQRHATRALLRDLSLRAVIGLIAGDAGALQAAISAAGTLAGLQYRRHDEEAADVAGMKRMQRIKADPQGMVSFFEILDKENPDLAGPLAYLSTHPRTGDRIARLRNMAAEAAYRPEPLLPGRAWDEVKRLCR